MIAEAIAIGKSEWGLRVISLVVFITSWELVARDMWLVAPPSEFFVFMLRDLFIDRTLFWVIVDGLRQGVIGFILALLVGIPMGFLIGFWQPANDVLSPIVDALYVTPLVAFVPLFIIWFGLSLTAKVVLVFLVSLFVVIINTEAGVVETPNELVDTARVFGASDWVIYREVHLQHAMPYIMAGVRLSAGRAVRGMVVAELFIFAGPLGRYLVESGAQFNMEKLFAGITALSLLGVLILQSIQRIEDRLLVYRESGR